MDATIYQDGTYLTNNPGWHSDDSGWKAGHIARMLERHALVPASVCEVGCGSGEILVQLASRLAPKTALALLKAAGYRVIDHSYTSGATELGNFGWKAQLIKLPRKALYRINSDLAARLLGGYSLLVLAE